MRKHILEKFKGRKLTKILFKSCQQASIALILLGFTTSVVHAMENSPSDTSLGTENDGFRVAALRNWFFFSFLPEGDVAETLGLETESYFSLGNYDIKNISYLEIADYPRPIPGQPPGNVSPGTEVDTGINDLLSAFWISRKNAHHGNHHFSLGVAAQFPTASNESLGSGKWSAGPSFDYEYESGRLFAGVIVLQLWSFAGDSDRKKVNFLMAKPFAVYKLNTDWDLIYMPYGISVYWDKPSGEDAYVPLGGGLQRHFKWGSQKMNFSLQYFNNVIRPTKGTEHDLRFMLEFVWD
jgi:hypothetical protein